MEPDPIDGVVVDEREVQATLRELAATPVEYPARKDLVLRGRAGLAGVEYNPDDHVPPEVDEMLQEGVPKNTRDTYEYQWGRFIHWCGVTGRQHLPATRETIRFYIWSHWGAVRADGRGRGRRGRPYAPATVELAVYTVSIVHQWLGHATPTRHPKIRTQLRGYAARWAKAGHVPDKASALTPEESVAIARTQNLLSVNGLRNATMCRLQFDMGARASEIVGLDLGDLRWVDDNTIQVMIRRSKTDQDARGRAVTVEAVRDYAWDVDPARLLGAWVDATRAAGYNSGPLFREASYGPPRGDGTMSGKIRPERATVIGYESAFVRAVVKAGLNTDPRTGLPRRVTSHSNRAGMITAARNAGMLAEQVAPRTGHSKRSNTIHDYWRGGDQIGADNAGTRIRQSLVTEPDYPSA